MMLLMKRLCFLLLLQFSGLKEFLQAGGYLMMLLTELQCPILEGFPQAAFLSSPGKSAFQFRAKRGKAMKAVLVDDFGGPATYFKGDSLGANGERIDAGGCIGGLGIDCCQYIGQVLRSLGEVFPILGSERGILFVVLRLLFCGLAGDA
jgi:hypothetical protein